MKKQTKIAIIGLGYVGLPLAILANLKGYEVVGIDIDIEKIRSIQKRISPYVDTKITEDLQKCSLKATNDFDEIKDVSVIIICVPTPVHSNYMPDLEPIKNSCRAIALNLKKDQLVILESTVNPGVSEEIVLPMLEKISGLRCGEDFYFAHCPERINPGDPNWNVENIPRVVGSLEKKGLKKAISFYKSIISGNIKPMGSLKEAEAVKVVENSFRDVNIAFVNELAMSFTKLGIDVVNVIDGAATKPFAFMAHYPGCGVGGHCIPVDPYYLIQYAKKNGFKHKFLKVARETNIRMPKFTANLVVKGLLKQKIRVKGTKVAVLGLAYKPNIGDDRESPSYKIIENLKNHGLKVSTFDPFVLHKSTEQTLKQALNGAKAVVVATSHDLFEELIPEYLISEGIRVVIDGRNCLQKDRFNNNSILYTGIGR